MGLCMRRRQPDWHKSKWRSSLTNCEREKKKKEKKMSSTRSYIEVDVVSNWLSRWNRCDRARTSCERTLATRTHAKIISRFMQWVLIMDCLPFVDQWRMQHPTNERSSIIAHFTLAACLCVSVCMRTHAHGSPPHRASIYIYSIQQCTHRAQEW